MGIAQERTMTAMYPTPAIKLSDNEQRILFLRAPGAASEKQGVVADITLEINKALCTTRVPAHIIIQRLAYNGKGNLRGMTGLAATSNMRLPLHRKLLLPAARE